MSKDADAFDVNELVTHAKLLDGGNVIRQAVVTEVAVVVVVKHLRTKRRANVIELHHDKSKLRQRHCFATMLEVPLTHRPNLRSRIDVRNDRVGLRGIEIGWQVQQAVDVGDTITRLDREQ